METKIIVLALALFLLFGIAMVQAPSWEDDWSSDEYDYGDYPSGCCGPVFILLAIGLGLVSYKHF